MRQFENKCSNNRPTIKLIFSNKQCNLFFPGHEMSDDEVKSKYRSATGHLPIDLIKEVLCCF